MVFVNGSSIGGQHSTTPQHTVHRYQALRYTHNFSGGRGKNAGLGERQHPPPNTHAILKGYYPLLKVGVYE